VEKITDHVQSHTWCHGKDGATLQKKSQKNPSLTMLSAPP